MTVTIELPDDIARALVPHGNLSHRALEGFALEEFRAGRLPRRRLRRLLGFSTRQELDGFLRAHAVFVEYPVKEFEQDLRAAREWLVACA
jgi:hypothetical protein